MNGRRWGGVLVAGFGLGVAVLAIALCGTVLASHEKQRQIGITEADALGYVRSFMTEFTSPDPAHAQDYTERIMNQATDGFAEEYQKNRDEIVKQVASAAPTVGTVLDAGVSRLNDDGSVEALVVTKFGASAPDGKLLMERSNRWVVTAKREGGQWKISNLTPTV